MTPEEHNPPQPQSEPMAKAASSIGVKELLIPVSIAIAGAFIGIGLYFSGTGPTGSAQNAPAPTNERIQEQQQDNTSKVAEVTADDWIKGNPAAPIKIVEFSDYDCPFCSRFHATMDEIVAESDGEIAWIFRHFPLEQLHPQAAAVALAAECVGAEGGNDAFWQFSDSYFETRGARDGTPHAQLIPRLATEAGANPTTFNECFENGTYNSKIASHLNNAVETGGRGTPWSILITPDGSTYPINGAQPKQSVEQLINFVQQEA